MRVAVYYSNADVRLEERPRPKPGPGELLMKVEASGVCGSDVMEWYRVPKAPIVLGHEVAHATHEHSRKQFKKQMWIQLAAIGLGLVNEEVKDEKANAIIEQVAHPAARDDLRAAAHQFGLR